jgi:hypothetical protein
MALVVSLVACGYAVVFGTCEVLRIPFRQLGLTWQVPAQWLRGRSATIRTLIWGACLGPGFVTRNPYAGMWVLPLLVALAPNWMAAMLLGIAIGLAHGSSRAVGILRNLSRLEEVCAPVMILKQMRWRFFDGSVLLLLAGSLAFYSVHLLTGVK